MRLSEEARKARRKSGRIMTLLEREQGKRRRTRPSEPLEEFILGVLEDRGTFAGARSALRGLREEFVDWNELRVSQPRDIVGVITTLQMPNEKAQGLKNILQAIFREWQELSLEQVYEKRLSRGEAEKFLARFPAASTHAKHRLMLLCMGIDRLPVNGEMLRVAKRAGVLAAHLSFDAGRQELVRIVPSRKYYACYCTFTEHGGTVCLSTRSKCGQCVINRECDSSGDGRARTTRKVGAG